METEEGTGTARFSDAGTTSSKVHGARLSRYYKNDMNYKKDLNNF